MDYKTETSLTYIIETLRDDGIDLVNMGKAQPEDKSQKKDRSLGLTTSDASALVKRGRRK